MLVLDTHAFLWAHLGIRIPRRVERRILSAGKANELLISAITPWEIALGARRGRIKIAGDVLDWIGEALDALSATVATLEPAIAVDAVDLGWDHADPSDRIIVATARRHRAALVTADGAILDFARQTGAVRVVEL